MKIKSTFALLDVTKGRQSLAKHFAGQPASGKCPIAMRVPVTITGYIEGVWGGDDGVSREFSVHVDSVTTEPVAARTAGGRV